MRTHSYSDALDLFVLSEGDATVVRTPSGCDIMQSAQMLRWPHDAVILPAATDRGQVRAAPCAAWPMSKVGGP